MKVVAGGGMRVNKFGNFYNQKRAASWHLDECDSRKVVKDRMDCQGSLRKRCSAAECCGFVVGCLFIYLFLHIVFQFLLFLVHG